MERTQTEDLESSRGHFHPVSKHGTARHLLQWRIIKSDGVLVFRSRAFLAGNLNCFRVMEGKNTRLVDENCKPQVIFPVKGAARVVTILFDVPAVHIIYRYHHYKEQ